MRKKSVIRLLVSYLFQVIQPLCCVILSCSAMSSSLRPHGLQPARLLFHGDSPGKNTGMGCHALRQGNLPNPGIKPRSPALQVDSSLSEPPGKWCLATQVLTVQHWYQKYMELIPRNFVRFRFRYLGNSELENKCININNLTLMYMQHKLQYLLLKTSMVTKTQLCREEESIDHPQFPRISNQ